MPRRSLKRSLCGCGSSQRRTRREAGRSTLSSPRLWRSPRSSTLTFPRPSSLSPPASRVPPSTCFARNPLQHLAAASSAWLNQAPRRRQGARLRGPSQPRTALPMAPHLGRRGARCPPRFRGAPPTWTGWISTAAQRSTQQRRARARRARGPTPSASSGDLRSPHRQHRRGSLRRLSRAPPWSTRPRPPTTSAGQGSTRLSSCQVPSRQTGCAPRRSTRGPPPRTARSVSASLTCRRCTGGALWTCRRSTSAGVPTRCPSTGPCAAAERYPPPVERACAGARGALVCS